MSGSIAEKTGHPSREFLRLGQTSGIDFRYQTGSQNLIVQCKHYAESGFAALRRVLEQKERPKLAVLKPTRYVLVTSVPTGRKLQVEVDRFTARLYERAEEIESERAKEEAPDNDDEHWRPSRREGDDVHEMFDDLRNYLIDG